GFDCSKAKTLESAMKQIKAKLNSIPKESKGLLVVIDEAFSRAAHLLQSEGGKNFIQKAEKFRPTVRFLFIDADLNLHRKDLSESQFMGRCEEFVLPPLSRRHGDIPYIFAASCLRHLKADSVRITEAVLLAVIDWVLRTPDYRQSPRGVFKKAKQVVDRMRRETYLNRGLPVEISKRHLPDDLSLEVDEVEIHKHVFQFFWELSAPADNTKLP